MSAKPELSTLLEHLHILNSKLEELTTRADQIKSQRAEMFQRVRELSMRPDINKQVAEILPRILQVKSTVELAQAIDETTSLTSSLEAIFLSPRVEEFLAVLRTLLSFMELKLPPEVESWVRKGLKGASETDLDQIIETAKSMIGKEKNVSLLKRQFAKWLSHKVSESASLKETYASLTDWVNETNSGIDGNLALQVLLTQIKDAEPRFQEASGLVTLFYQTCLRELEQGFEKRIKDALTYWSESESNIEETWQSAKVRLTTLNSLIQQLSDAERQLVRKHIGAHRQIRLRDFNSFLDELSESVHAVLESKKSVGKIMAHIDSTKNVKFTDTRLIELNRELEQLQKHVRDPTSRMKFGSYIRALGTLSKKYIDWEQRFNVLTEDVRRETESWRGVCTKQGLDTLGTRISIIMSKMPPEILIGGLASTHTELLGIYEEIKGELAERGDPDLLEAVVRLQATKTSVGLADIEDELRKVRPTVTREAILASLADLESKKLVTVDIKT